VVSDRLRRRDDVTHALGAPVKLSVGPVRLSRWRPGRHGLAAANGTDVRRIVAYLRGAVPSVAAGPTALAVVPVDDPEVAALSLVSLAVSRAQEGRTVVVADLAVTSGGTALHQLVLQAAGRLAVALAPADATTTVGDLWRSPDAEEVRELILDRVLEPHRPVEMEVGVWGTSDDHPAARG